MSMNGKYGDYIKVKYVSDKQYTGFEKGQVVEATFLKSDPRGIWYVIPDPDGEEYAYPRSWFEEVNE